MRRLVLWLRSWWIGSRAVNKLTEIELRCQIAEASRTASEERLRDLRREFDSLVDVMRKEFDRVENVHRRNDQALDELRHTLRVAEDITIPTLVAANKLLQSRWEAEVAIQERRRITAVGVTE